MTLPFSWLGMTNWAVTLEYDFTQQENQAGPTIEPARPWA
jgi:hypothetical protein